MAIIFEKKVNIKDIKKILLSKGNLFAKIINISIFVYQSENHFLVVARDPDNEENLSLLNIWKNGQFMFDKKIFPTTRLRNMKGKTLRATSFDRAPNVYKDEYNQWTGSEVSK